MFSNCEMKRKRETLNGDLFNYSEIVSALQHKPFAKCIRCANRHTIRNPVNLQHPFSTQPTFSKKNPADSTENKMHCLFRFFHR